QPFLLTRLLEPPEHLFGGLIAARLHLNHATILSSRLFRADLTPPWRGNIPGPSIFGPKCPIHPELTAVSPTVYLRHNRLQARLEPAILASHVPFVSKCRFPDTLWDIYHIFAKSAMP